MADISVLHAATLARLREVSGQHVPVYDSTVDDTPPVDTAGVLTGYIVLWAHPGAGDNDARDMSGSTGGSLIYSPRATAVGGTPTRCLQVVQLLRQALEGWRPITGAGQLHEQPTGPDTVLEDRDVKPSRFYVPTQFTCHTP